MNKNELKKRYEDAIKWDKPLQVSQRELVLSPAAARQETASKAHKWSMFGPFLIGDEYTNWYDESIALRTTAALGDWSPLAKYDIKGPDAGKFSGFLCTRDLSKMEMGQRC